MSNSVAYTLLLRELTRCPCFSRYGPLVRCARQLFAAPYNELRALKIDLDAERLTWVVLVHNLAERVERDRYGRELARFEGVPFLWILAQSGCAERGLAHRILAFL